MVPKTVPAETTAKPVGLVLPVQILTPGDISRLIRELQDLEEFFEEASIKGANLKTVPQSTQQMTTFVKENNLNLLHEADRAALKKYLAIIKTKAPVVHLSFATDPKPDFLMKLALWFRTNADPYVLIQVGLQPNIAAGCVLRTTNKYFDLSFKQHFLESKAKLAIALGSAL